MIVVPLKTLPLSIEVSIDLMTAATIVSKTEDKTFQMPIQNRGQNIGKVVNPTMNKTNRKATMVFEICKPT